jgi:hypothetical protein
MERMLYRTESETGGSRVKRGRQTSQARGFARTSPRNSRAWERRWDSAVAEEAMSMAFSIWLVSGECWGGHMPEKGPWFWLAVGASDMAEPTAGSLVWLPRRHDINVA